MKRLWKAAYYPKEMIEDQRTKTILCLLFDKIVCHFPVSDMACGGGSGISDFFSDGPLVKAGIIELEEETLLPHIDEEDFDKYIDLQITAMALQKCQQQSIVPVTDNINFQIPAFILKENNILRNAKFQAASIAISSIEMVLPSIDKVDDEDILRLRDELSDELIPFRRSMLKLAPLIRQYTDEDASIKEMYNEANYIAETSIIPALEILREKIEREEGVFWRKLLLKSGAILPKFMLNWTQKSILSAAIDSVGDFSDLALSSIDRQALIDSIKCEGGLGFLLSLEKYPRNKSKDSNREFNSKVVYSECKLG